MSNTYGINLLDAGIVGDDEVDELREVLVRSGLAHKEPYMLEGVSGPRAQDQNTNEDSTKRVKVPYDTTSNDGHGQTEGVHNDVVPVVHEEDVYRRITTEEEAVET